jgi:hypothetical protein
MPGWP